jgi:signal transduction histidine kinase
VKPTSFRARVTIVAGALALVVALGAGALVEHRGNERFLSEERETLTDEADELLLLLQDPKLEPFVEDFLRVEISERTVKNRYYYLVRDLNGNVLVHSPNAELRSMPLPQHWSSGKSGITEAYETVQDAHTLDRNDLLLVRSERVGLKMFGRAEQTVIIQTAASLAAWRQKVRDELVTSILGASAIFVGITALLYVVADLALRPVTRMTARAKRITARNLEERLPLSGRGDELDDLATQLNHMLDRLSDALRHGAEFAARTAHQLRLPLTRLRTSVDFYLREEMRDAIRKPLEDVAKELARMSQVCNRLLLLGRIEARTAEAGALDDMVDLVGVVDELAEQCTPFALDSRVALQRAAPAHAYIRGNRILLVEALLNLIDNAIRHTPPGGTVRLVVQDNVHERSVSVEDNGPGVSDAQRELIFESFYQTEERPSLTPGGLGLAIVRAVVQAHAGRIELTSAPGQTTAFRLIFPAARQSDP